MCCSIRKQALIGVNQLPTPRQWGPVQRKTSVNSELYTYLKFSCQKGFFFLNKKSSALCEDRKILCILLPIPLGFYCCIQTKSSPQSRISGTRCTILQFVSSKTKTLAYYVKRTHWCFCLVWKKYLPWKIRVVFSGITSGCFHAKQKRFTTARNAHLGFLVVSCT